LADLAAELVRARVDVIVTGGSQGTMAAKQATQTIAIVFWVAGSVVQRGIVASLARAAAERLIQDGYAGLVCGHTHHAELSPVESGFYANTGSGTKVVDRVDSWFGLPPVFLPRIQLSWVILDTADATWKVTLTAGRRNVPGSTRLEHRVARRGAFVPNEPAVVASYP
jgi:hypothetical protein